MELTVTLFPPGEDPVTAPFTRTGAADVLAASTYSGTALAGTFARMESDLEQLRGAEGVLPGLRVMLGRGSGRVRNKTLAESKVQVVSASVVAGSERADTILALASSNADAYAGTAATSTGYYSTPNSSEVESNLISVRPDPTDPPGLTGPDQGLFTPDANAPRKREPREEGAQQQPRRDSVAAVEQLLPSSGAVAGAQAADDPSEDSGGSSPSGDDQTGGGTEGELSPPSDLSTSGVADSAIRSDSNLWQIALVALMVVAVLVVAVRRVGQR
jgi:hypothetical protein